MQLAPKWERVLADVNPFSHIVDASRAAFRDDLGGDLTVGLLCAAGLALLGLVVANHTFQRESA
jgi:ABC-2 type transport system permease protein